MVGSSPERAKAAPLGSTLAGRQALYDTIGLA
jgi:hypothetical protein